MDKQTWESVSPALSDSVLKTVKELGFKTLTPVQVAHFYDHVMVLIWNL